MFSFIARLCNLIMIGLAKEFLTKTATVTVSQSVLTTAARMRNTGWDLENTGKRGDSFLHQRPSRKNMYAAIHVLKLRSLEESCHMM